MLSLREHANKFVTENIKLCVRHNENIYWGGASSAQPHEVFTGIGPTEKIEFYRARVAEMLVNFINERELLKK